MPPVRKGPRRVRGSLPPPPPPRHPRAPPPSMTFIDSEKTSRYSHLASPPNPRGTLSKHEGGEEQPSRLVTVDGAATPIDAARKRARGGVVTWPEEGLPRRRARAVVERPRGRSTLVRDEAVVRRLKYSQSSINSVAAPHQSVASQASWNGLESRLGKSLWVPGGSRQRLTGGTSK